MNGRKRKVQIKFYVTEEERALIEQKMKLVPTRNMAAYLRKIAIDGYIIQTDHSDIKAMTAEIQKIGVNINQIAKRVNATSLEAFADASVKTDRSFKAGALAMGAGYRIETMPGYLPSLWHLRSRGGIPTRKPPGSRRP